MSARPANDMMPDFLVYLGIARDKAVLALCADSPEAESRHLASLRENLAKVEMLSLELESVIGAAREAKS